MIMIKGKGPKKREEKVWSFTMQYVESDLVGHIMVVDVLGNSLFAEACVTHGTTIKFFTLYQQ